MVDAVQNSKKQFIATFVPNEKIAVALNDFVDQQTVYTKSFNKSITQSITVIAQETVTMMKDPSKFDLFKFYNNQSQFTKK